MVIAQTAQTWLDANIDPAKADRIPHWVVQIANAVPNVMDPALFTADQVAPCLLFVRGLITLDELTAELTGVPAPAWSWPAVADEPIVTLDEIDWPPYTAPAAATFIVRNQRCACGEWISMADEAAEVVRGGEHVLVHVSCMQPGDLIA